MLSLSPEQRKAMIFQPGLNVSVTAGAGAGKTTILTERFLQTLLQPVKGTFPNEIQHILTITFTEKAAGEMQTRIYQSLSAMILREKNPDRLLHLKKAKDNFYKSKISTIHSFCAALLRENPIESGMDPNFSILQAAEQLQLLEESIQVVLKNLMEKPQDSSPLKALLSFWSIQQIRNTIKLMLSDRFRYLQFKDSLNAGPAEILVLKLQNALTAITIDRLKDSSLSRMIGDLETFCCKKSNSQESKDREKAERLLGQYIKTAKDCLLPLQQENFYAKKEELKFILGYSPGKSGFRIPAQYSPVAIRACLQDSGLEVLLKDPVLDLQALQKTFALIAIADRVHEVFQKRKQLQNRVDFEDLLLQSHRFLVNLQNSTSPMALQILQKLRARYGFILVDEFQDIDTLQWEIIKSLATNANGRLANLFIVGDEKQSIYAFRGGDITLFATAKNAMSGSGQLYDCSLNDNYRSNEAIISFVNYLFQHLFAADDSLRIPVAARPQALCCKRGKTDPAIPAGTVESAVRFLVVSFDTAKEREDGTALTPYEMEARLIAEKIDELMQEKDPDNPLTAIKEKITTGQKAIGILFRRATHMKIYEEALRRRGIDFVVNRGRGFFARQEVSDIINLLDFLNDPRKDISLVGALRSPLGCLEDYDLLKLRRLGQGSFYELLRHCHNHLRTLCDPGLVEAHDQESSRYEFYQKLSCLYLQMESWIYLKDRMRISELIRHILTDSQFSVSLFRGGRGSQAHANVEKFIQIARDFEMGGVRSLAEFLQYLQEHIQAEAQEAEGAEALEQAGAVQLMTIHAAKGLQFPLVILPDLYAYFHLSERILFEKVSNEVLNSNLREGYSTLLGFKVPDPENRMEPADTIMRRLLSHEHSIKVTCEEKRLFYVACTRAEDHLWMLLRSNAKIWQTGKKINDCNSYAEWLGCVFPALEQAMQQQGCSYLHGNGNRPPRILVSVQKPDRSENSRSDDIKKMLSNWNDLFCDTASPPAVTCLLDPLSENIMPRVSATGLSLFAGCPRRFYYKNVLGMPESYVPASREHGRRGSNQTTEAMAVSHAALVRGLVVHEVFEKDLLFKERVIHESRFTDSFLKTVDAMIQMHVENIRLPLRAEVFPLKDRIKKEVLSSLYNFTMDKTFFPKFLSFSRGETGPSFAEIPFRLQAGGCILTGILDKLYYDDKEQGWIVLDYKTDILDHKTKEMVVREHHYALQLGSYVFAAENILGSGKVKKALLYFTNSAGDAVVSYKTFDLLQLQMHNRVFPNLAEVLQHIRNCILEGEEAFPCCPLPDCSPNCGYAAFAVCRG